MVCQMIMGPISLIFCGHLGDKIQLDGAALAISVSIWISMRGVRVCAGSKWASFELRATRIVATYNAQENPKKNTMLVCVAGCVRCCLLWL